MENQVLVPTKTKKDFIPKIKYAKHHKLGTKFVIFVAIIMACSILFNVCDIMSSVITNSRSLIIQDKIYVPSYSVYGVSSDEFDTLADAELYCEKISSTGALATPFEDGKFFALVHIYPTLLSAKEVQQNLINLGYPSKIVTINVPQIKTSYYGNNKDSAQEGFGIFRRVYLSLYEANISFDKKAIQRETLLGKVALQIEEIERVKEKSYSLGITKNQQKIFDESLDNCTKILNTIFSFSGGDQELSSAIKKHMFDIITQNIYFSKNFI